jgi:hypothetical protein
MRALERFSFIKNVARKPRSLQLRGGIAVILSVKKVFADASQVQSFAGAAAWIFVPSNLRRSKYPVNLFPTMKHAAPFQQTLSNL